MPPSVTAGGAIDKVYSLMQSLDLLQLSWDPRLNGSVWVPLVQLLHHTRCGDATQAIGSILSSPLFNRRIHFSHQHEEICLDRPAYLSFLARPALSIPAQISPVVPALAMTCSCEMVELESIINGSNPRWEHPTGLSDVVRYLVSSFCVLVECVLTSSRSSFVGSFSGTISSSCISCFSSRLSAAQRVLTC
jgi:hypothetical protein